MTGARQVDPSPASGRTSQDSGISCPMSEHDTASGDAPDTRRDAGGAVSVDKAAVDLSGASEAVTTPMPRPTAPEAAAIRVAQLDAERAARGANKAARREAEKEAQANEASATAAISPSKERKRLETQVQEMKIAQAELARLRPANPQRRHYIIALSFVLFALVPIGLTAWYLYVRAADQYASYVGFLVRSEKNNSSLEQFSGLAALAGSNSSSDTDILYKYLQSSALVGAVAANVDLNEIWSREPDDVVFNYGGDPRVEGLHHHWKRQVAIYYDEGMLDLRVLSFRAEDSRRIAEAILEESQQTLNRINAVARQDSLRYAQQDLDFAVVRLKEARQAVSNFRQTNQIIDPTADVTGQAAILTTLQTQLAEALVQLGTLRANAPDGDPRVQAAELRVKVIRDQIRNQRSNIASDGDSDLSGIVSQYEALQVDRLFAESSYTAALASYESARAEAGRQSLYLAAYVTPVEAQTAEYPRRARLLALAAGFIFSMWLLAVLFYYGSRDRR